MTLRVSVTLTLSEFVASLFVTTGKEYRSATTHPAMIQPARELGRISIFFRDQYTTESAQTLLPALGSV